MIPQDKSVWVKDGTLYHKSEKGHIQKILHGDYAEWVGVERSVFAKILRPVQTLLTVNSVSRGRYEDRTFSSRW